ncbi:MAG: UDP-N-acetylmuramate--L-alanine ligase [Bacteroidales bacterium]|jgi:UDP-N-acetylmuramate--alanine ligase|nr:UDP-N-acetylmuramate--L-alanine ligase [Bacteroidales bacterium]
MFNQTSHVYLIGIGGIGMSALARYFKAEGCEVCGYDRTETALTRTLVAEGIAVHHTDDVNAIPQSYKKVKFRVLVVYTPAVPASNSEMQWFRARNYRMVKRSRILGSIVRGKKNIAIAGTHGKTSISTLAAHLLTAAGVGCDAFLGGISKNYNSNLLLAKRSAYVVVEADEYDRSFLRLHPCIAVVTAMDADHLDIYRTHVALKKAFAQFVSQITPGGLLIIKHGLTLPVSGSVRTFTYSLLDHDADFYVENMRMDDDRYLFSLRTPCGLIENIRMGVPGLVNVENGIAAIAVSCFAGVDAEKIRAGMSSFEGVQRRFDERICTDEAVYINDYAHHPEELRFTIESVRALYPDRRITGVFQPHLYSRTRDLADEFAQSLSLLDTLILLDIYPAREEPIEGVTSKMIFDKVTIADKRLCAKDEVINILNNRKPGVLLTLGAGDIDSLAEPIEKMLKSKIKEHHHG